MGLDRIVYRWSRPPRPGRGRGIGVRLGFAGVVLAVASGTGLAVAVEPGDPPGSEPGRQPLVWTDCRDGFQCATAQVPLDYRAPKGATIGLALIRRQVADPAKRAGTLVLQPGGPGNSGVNFVRGNYAGLPAALRDKFDVFGFDARGTAASGQLECFDDARYSQAVTAAKGRPADGAFAPALREAAAFVEACAQKQAALLPFVGTDHVARDLDLLREALGEQQLSFYGRSFGSYLGTLYADLFPRRVRAMVLDGGYDPQHYANDPYAYDRPQYKALDGAVGRFLDWCQATPALCPFGNGDPRAAFERLLRALDAQPVPVPNRGTANGYTVAYRLLFNINAGKTIWPSLGKALQQAEQRNTASLLLSPPSPASFDFLVVNVVVECVDRNYPRDPRRLEREVTANVRKSPLLGPPLTFGPPTYDHQHALACVQWKAERTSRYRGDFRAQGAPPILVLGTTGDPDTPYRDSVALARTLERGRLLTFQAEGHTAFNRSKCATAAVAAYLADLTLPAKGTVCADEVQPAPTPPVATATRGVPGTRGLDETTERMGVWRP